jgi:hypothetical protein
VDALGILATAGEDCEVSAIAYFVALRSGDGGSVADVDAYDGTSQTWLPDDFLSVSPDSGLTAAANNGEIDTSTLNGTETLTASDPLESGFLAFQAWVVSPPPVTSPALGTSGGPSVLENELSLHRDNQLYAFAVYQESDSGAGSPTSRRLPFNQPQFVFIPEDVGLARVPRGSGGGGPIGPIAERLASVAKLLEAAALLSGEPQFQVLRIAENAANSVARAIHAQIPPQTAIKSRGSY